MVTRNSGKWVVTSSTQRGSVQSGGACATNVVPVCNSTGSRLLPAPAA